MFVDFIFYSDVDFLLQAMSKYGVGEIWKEEEDVESLCVVSSHVQISLNLGRWEGLTQW